MLQMARCCKCCVVLLVLVVLRVGSELSLCVTDGEMLQVLRRLVGVSRVDGDGDVSPRPQADIVLKPGHVSARGLR